MKDCQIRAGALTGYIGLVCALGGDPDAVLGQCGLSAPKLQDPDQLVSYRKVMQAIEAGASELGCPDFGLQLKQQQDLTFLGPLALVIQSAKTVREGFVLAGKHMAFHTPGVLLKLEPDGGALERIEFHLLLTGLPEFPQVVEHAVAHMVNTLTILANGKFGAHSVHFTHKAQSPLSVYRQHLAIAPTFESTFNGLMVDIKAMRSCVETGNTVLKGFAERFVLAGQPSGDAGAADQVQWALAQLAPSGQGNLLAVSRVLQIHPRTLQRQLRREGFSFDQLQAQHMKELAMNLLAQKHIPLDRVAHLLGFAEQAVLTRACKRWFGQTPGRLRSAG